MRREILRNLDERKGGNENIYICIYNVLEGDYARRGPRGIVLAGGRCSPRAKLENLSRDFSPGLSSRRRINKQRSSVERRGAYAV